MNLKEARSLKKDQAYAFQIRDWETPLGEVIPGQKKERIFLDVEIRHATIGDEGIPFIRVLRNDGKTHLIAIETIESFEELHS